MGPQNVLWDTNSALRQQDGVAWKASLFPSQVARSRLGGKLLPLRSPRPLVLIVAWEGGNQRGALCSAFIPCLLVFLVSESFHLLLL